ncbi:cysteine rich repeat-containing protein [Methylobacterium oxalidis]|uniref:cysteine rich repeat-containing protein n=1 Tax=Methylobacterium oxalidis TaxID=944322 RepID=UPI003315151C
MRMRHVAIASLAFAMIATVNQQAVQAQGAPGGPLAACKADAERICPGVQPGGGRLIECLKAHEDDVTIGCAKELKAIKAKMGK